MDRYQDFSNYSPGIKGPTPEVTCFTVLVREKKLKSPCLKNQKAETLNFGMYLQLEGLYQDCSNYGPGVRMAPSQGSLVLLRLIWGKTLNLLV